jgi:nitroreductase
MPPRYRLNGIYTCDKVQIPHQRGLKEAEMELMQIAEQRRSIRAFADRSLEEEKLQRILEIVSLAPSAGNLQAYEVYIVTDRRQKLALAKASLGQAFVAEAPVVLVFCAHPERSAGRYGERGRRLYSLQDATIACTYAMLAVTDLGLATVWVGAFGDDAVSRAIDLPSDEQPVALLPIGYGAEQPAAAPRRSLSDLIHRL